MKTLELEFKRNCDGKGIHIFRQLKREKNVALYVRLNPATLKPLYYESIVINITPAGTVFADGSAPVEEDYEVYPRAKSFGKIAYCSNNLQRGEYFFQVLLEKVNYGQLQEAVDDDLVSVKSKRRGRRAIKRDFTFPNDRFTMKQLHQMNPSVSFALLYQYVRANLQKLFKIVETIGGKRGKPTIVYAPIDLPVVNSEFKSVEQKLNS